MGTRAPRARSIVGSFSPLPWLEYAAGSVLPPTCHLALVASRALPVTMYGAVQNDSRRATTRDEPGVIKQAEPSLRFGEPAQPRRDGRSVEPVRYKRYSAVPRSPSQASRP